MAVLDSGIPLWDYVFNSQILMVSRKGNVIKFREFVSRKAAKEAQRRKGMFFFAALRETNSLNYHGLAN